MTNEPEAATGPSRVPVSCPSSGPPSSHAAVRHYRGKLLPPRPIRQRHLSYAIRCRLMWIRTITTVLTRLVLASSFLLSCGFADATEIHAINLAQDGSST